MELTTTKENLVEKLKLQITKNILAGLVESDLTDEEKDAQMVLTKRSIDKDANVIADLVFTALTE